MERKSLEVVEVAEPGAEFVERDADAELGEPAQPLRSAVVGEPKLIGDRHAQSRLNGLIQLTKGLSGIVRKAGKREKAAA